MGFGGGWGGRGCGFVVLGFQRWFGVGIANSVCLGVFHRWDIPTISREMQELPIPCVGDKNKECFVRDVTFSLRPGNCKISRGNLKRESPNPYVGIKLGVFQKSWDIPINSREMQESPIPCVWDKTGSVSAHVEHSHHLQGNAGITSSMCLG